MDPFAQRILERCEKRSKTLGISKTIKFPLTDSEQLVSHGSKHQQSMDNKETTPKTRKSKDIESPAKKCSPKMKINRNYTIDKENMDVGIEINITTGPDVEVQVDVQEQKVDGDGNSAGKNNIKKDETTAGVLTANIRDSSRNRLQRLGTLYSETDSLSSPIHRTEGNFQEDDTAKSITKCPNQKYRKLAALADSIKNWEDDATHIDYKSKKLEEEVTTAGEVKKVLHNKNINQQQQIKDVADLGPKQKTPVKSSIKQSIPKSAQKEQNELSPRKENKSLKWDKAVIDSLEAQGFQRRESSTVKFSYNYIEPIKSSEVQHEIKTGNLKLLSSESVQPSLFKKFDPIVTDNVKHSNSEEQKNSNIRTGLVSGRAAAFESKSISNASLKPQRDPAEMSLKERMMLFEKNKGKALLPKAALGMAAPAERDPQTANKNVRAQQERKIAEGKHLKDFAVADSKVRDKVAALSAGSSTISENSIKEGIRRQRQEEMQILANRFNKQRDAVQTTPEINAFKSSATTTQAPPPPPPMPNSEGNRHQHIEAQCTINNKRRSPGYYQDDRQVLATFDEAKRVRVTPIGKADRLYPSLSDIETTTESGNDNCTTATVSTYTSDEDKHSEDDDNLQVNESSMESDGDDSSDICNVSLGREIMQVVRSNDRTCDKDFKHSSDVYYEDSSLNSQTISDKSVIVDDYLDEAFDEDDDNDKIANQTAGTTSSNSFLFKRQSKKYPQYSSISDESEDFYTSDSNKYESPIKASMSVDPTDDNVVTLVHTVSFYRRQQTNSNNSTPVRIITRDIQKIPANASSSNNISSSNNYSSEDGSNAEDYDYPKVQEKIRKLLDEVCKQQQVIAQTSQALNLCAATIEFSGSTESVEGERHLLVATHRRQAALDEVQRLRVEGSIQPFGTPKEKGRLCVRDITIPLKQDYIRKLTNDDTMTGHQLVCLLRYNENILATKVVPTLPGLLAVKFPDVLQLNNVHADFKISLEIYGMTAHREKLPHEVKYHINLNKKSGIKTPKPKKGTESKLFMTPVQSPAGPNVVRTPALVKYGFAIFSLREIQRNTWTINQTTSISPLEGTVHMKINCELSVNVEHRGFLTMFQDISGFGAWHRRWCYLNGSILNYWKYPDDEKKKAPMGSVDLYSCVSKKITTAPRDVCARLNTLLLECERPSQDGDIPSLLIVPNKKNTIVRYLLSADTKDERDEWAAHFNKAVALLRAWGSQQ